MSGGEPSLEARITEIVRKNFEMDGFVFGCDTDLVLISQQADPDALGDALAEMGREFNLLWPNIPDRKGRLRRAQLFVEEGLTIRRLVAIVESGAFPQQWTRPGKYLPWFTAP